MNVNKLALIDSRKDGSSMTVFKRGPCSSYYEVYTMGSVVQIPREEWQTGKGLMTVLEEFTCLFVKFDFSFESGRF